MTPEQFIRDVAKNPPASIYLFVGVEGYQRGLCRKALLKAATGTTSIEAAGDAYSHLDLDEMKLNEALDDARAMSLFADRRLVWIASAESALPRGKALTAEDAESGYTAGLASYVKRPTPGVVVVLDARRFDLDSNEDKPRIERLQKFYTTVKNVVEFRSLSVEAARQLAQGQASKAKLQIGTGELGFLVEACALDAHRIINEIEKLSLYAGEDRKITTEDMAALLPNARTSNIFALVASLGRGDRGKSLEILDNLVREGEYLPLALTFVASQFRYALMAHESKLRSSQAIQGHFSKLGIRMWRDRAEQVLETMTSFSAAKTERAVRLLFAADRGLRDARPDDRSVFEQLILQITD